MQSHSRAGGNLEIQACRPSLDPRLRGDGVWRLPARGRRAALGAPQPRVSELIIGKISRMSANVKHLSMMVNWQKTNTYGNRGTVSPFTRKTRILLEIVRNGKTLPCFRSRNLFLSIDFA